MNYILALAIGLDQLLNAAIGGDPDEMISARAHRRAEDNSRGWAIAEILINNLFFWQKKHCKDAYEYEKKIVLEKAKLYSDTEQQ